MLQRTMTALFWGCLAMGPFAVAAADDAGARAADAGSAGPLALPAQPTSANPDHPPSIRPVSEVGARAADAGSANPLALPTPPTSAKPGHSPSTGPVSGTPAGPTPEARAVEAAVQIGDRRLFLIRAPRAGIPPEQRARQASRLLEQLVADGQRPEARFALEGSTAVVYVGATPIIQLSEDDATRAGDASLTVHAEGCASAIREGLRIELRRRAVANIVFSLSLVVLSGLLSFLLLGAVARAALRIADLLEARVDLPGWHLGSIEVLTPAAVRVAVSTAISIAKPMVQFAILAGWLVFALSLIPATAALGGRLTGFLLVPATAFFARIGAALPVLVVVIIGGFAIDRDHGAAYEHRVDSGPLELTRHPRSQCLAERLLHACAAPGH